MESDPAAAGNRRNPQQQLSEKPEVVTQRPPTPTPNPPVHHNPFLYWLSELISYDKREGRAPRVLVAPVYRTKSERWSDVTLMCQAVPAMDKNFEIYAPSEEYKPSAKVLLKMGNDARTQMIEELFSTISYAQTSDSYHQRATTSSGEIKSPHVERRVRHSRTRRRHRVSFESTHQRPGNSRNTRWNCSNV